MVGVAGARGAGVNAYGGVVRRVWREEGGVGEDWVEQVLCVEGEDRDGRNGDHRDGVRVRRGGLSHDSVGNGTTMPWK